MKIKFMFNSLDFDNDVLSHLLYTSEIVPVFCSNSLHNSYFQHYNLTLIDNYDLIVDN